jgi:hypothetical protein
VGQLGQLGQLGQPAIRDLYWKLPESYVLESGELVYVLYPLITQMTWLTKRRSLRLSRWRGGTGRNGGSMTRPLGWNPYLARYTRSA